MNSIGNYYESVVIGMRRGGFLSWVIVASWFLIPILAQTIMHPSDAAGFWYWLNGQHVPRYYSSHEIVRGEFTTVLVLAGVLFANLVATTLFYRRTQFWLSLWPLAALLVGVIGNAGWWFGTGTWDSAGALVGWMPAALAGIAIGRVPEPGSRFRLRQGQPASVQRFGRLLMSNMKSAGSRHFHAVGRDVLRCHGDRAHRKVTEAGAAGGTDRRRPGSARGTARARTASGLA
jgi:hypothetical protein